MSEAKPQNILPPETEPILRIGILLEEDKLTSTTFTLSEEDFVLQANTTLINLFPREKYTVRIADSKLELINKDTKIIFSSNDSLKLSSKHPLEISPQRGITVDNIPVGRTFHWRKSISQILPGTLEFHNLNQTLLLVNEIPFEDYLACVISSEMSPECPIEFSKAQAVAARSWALVFLSNKHPGKLYSICNDDDCQRYQGTTHLTGQSITAIDSCRGEILLTPSNFVCPAYYSKCCGGHSESPENAFGFSAPGNVSIFDFPPNSNLTVDLSTEESFTKWITKYSALNSFYPFCSHQCVPQISLNKYLGAVDITSSYFRWQINISKEELIQNLKTNHRLPDLVEVVNLRTLKRGNSGRILKMDLEYLASSGAIRQLLLETQYQIRKSLHPSFLYSSAFIFTINRSSKGYLETLSFKGAGWGHGVGLCQIGGVGMALNKYDYQEILKHYYPGTKIVRGYTNRQ